MTLCACIKQCTYCVLTARAVRLMLLLMLCMCVLLLQLDFHSLSDCLVTTICTDQAAAIPPDLYPSMVKDVLAQAEWEQVRQALHL
jgi:hypothetical protein